jgi:hypothetical protein
MTPEQILREKLNKIEALVDGAKTVGERVSARAAAARIRARLRKIGNREDVELDAAEEWIIEEDVELDAAEEWIIEEDVELDAAEE